MSLGTSKTLFPQPARVRYRVIIERFLIPVCHSAMLDEAFRFEPELVHVGAGPALAVPTEFIIGSSGAPFELIEKQVVEDGVVFDRRLSILRVNRRLGACRLSLDRATDHQNSRD